MEKVRYMISDAATMAGVESHVLRYWEDELELTIPRNEMGHRYYTRENIQEFQKIKELKEQGYQLKAIRMILHNDGVIPPNLNIEEAGQALGAASTAPNRAKAAPAISIIPPPASATAAANAPKPAAAQPSAAQPSVAAQPTAAQSVAARQSAVVQQSATAQAVTMPQVAATQQPAATAQTLAMTQPATQQPTALAAAPVRPAPAPLSAEERMAQFRELMSDIVGHAIAQNNEELSVNISQEVKETVLKEMNYLFREQEEAQEDRYKKLDAAIRGSIRKKKSLFAPKDKPAKKEKARAANKQATEQKMSIPSV